ncbi:MAG: nitrogen regulation protein NR(II) [bacterium]
MKDHPYESAPEFYADILDSLPLTVVVLNEDGDILEANQQWRDFGLRNDINQNYLNPGVNYLDVCRDAEDDYGQEAYHGLKKVLSGEESSFSMEYPCHSEDRDRWFLMKAKPLGDSDGRNVLVIHLDITQRVKSEQRLRHKEKLASIGKMSASIMHEINNPNAFISGNVDYLMKRLGKFNEQHENESGSPELNSFLDELKDILDDIKSGADRIDRIVNKVEEFSQKQTSDESETSLSKLPDLLSEIVHQAGQSSEVDFIKFEDQLPDDTSNKSILLSDDEIQAIVKNLLMNAVQAILDGETDDPEVDLFAVTNDNNLSIWVLDNGPGIKEELMPKIRDPFFSTRSISEGTGLGLSIVSNITQKVDGTFDLYTEPGEGTWAVVNIPIVVPGE